MAADSLPVRAAAHGRALAARWLVRRAVNLSVDGLHNLPSDGAAILAARHYHHLYDAAILLAVVPRALHVMVALDWLENPRQLAAMRWLCQQARWPAVWRQGSSVAGLRTALNLLSEGRLLLVFPEAYPTVDPQGSRKREDQIRQFHAGFATLARHTGAPVLPVGLAYQPGVNGRWTVNVCIGQPVRLDPGQDQDAFVQGVRRQVARLSGLPGEAQTAASGDRPDMPAVAGA